MTSLCPEKNIPVPDSSSKFILNHCWTQKAVQVMVCSEKLGNMLQCVSRLASGAHKGKEHSTAIYKLRRPCATSWRLSTYVHAWVTYSWTMAESLALGHGKKCLQDKAYPFVAKEHTFRTSWSNLSTLMSSSYTHLTFLFVAKSSLLCFWLFLGMSCCCCHSSLKTFNAV